MPTTKDRITARIHRLGAGRAFTPKDFLDLGSRGMVDVTLSKLVSAGVIRRVGRGSYDLPKHSEALGITLSPNIDEIAKRLRDDSAGGSSPPAPGRQISWASQRKSPPRSPTCPMAQTENSS